jgi:uncharacterized membrane protein YsdA (DUF1294 family)
MYRIEENCFLPPLLMFGWAKRSSGQKFCLRHKAEKRSSMAEADDAN